MKQKFLPIHLVLFFTITVIMTACSKEGPAGPAGPAGPQGTTGNTGATGATGATGTANVIYSSWTDLTFQGTDTTAWVAQMQAPKLVDSILNRGAIKVYFNYGSDSTNSDVVFPLPMDGNLGIIAEVYYQPGLINIIANTDLSSFTDNGNHYFQFRYVLIPGGITALPVSANGTKGSGINWNDYKQVKQYLGLSD